MPIQLPKLEVLEKEMDRKDFLKHVGVGAVLLLGGNLILGALNGLDFAHKKQSSLQSGQGYGGMRYGG